MKKKLSKEDLNFLQPVQSRLNRLERQLELLEKRLRLSSRINNRVRSVMISEFGWDGSFLPGEQDLADTLIRLKKNDSESTVSGD